MYIETALTFPSRTNPFTQLFYLEIDRTKLLSGLEETSVGPDMVAHTSANPALDRRLIHENPQKLKGQLALEYTAAHN